MTKYFTAHVACFITHSFSILAVGMALTMAMAFLGLAEAQTWRGLVVAEESRCSPYDKDDYRYSQSVESRIVDSLGGRVYSPYTGEWFADTGLTDIEHIVARSEAHDSGLCAATPERRRAFAQDLLNLTLASPTLNREHKSDLDAADWMPEQNQCWFADRVLKVRLRYGLTVDAREAAALEKVLSSCESTAVVIYSRRSAPIGDQTPDSQTTKPVRGPQHPLTLWDDNGNGRITCKEARRHGIAPVPSSHPAYRYMRDGDRDGFVCE